MGIPEGMREFLQGLFESGNVTVPFLIEPMPPVEEVAIFIRDFDAAARLNLPGEAPDLDLVSAHWAAALLMQGSRFLISRDTEAPTMEAVLSMPCPLFRDAEVDYSVDLFFRYLPDLCHFAKRLAQNDPLVGYLEKLASEWPLSSVPIDSIPAASIETFIGNPCLRQLYADRIIQHKALHRLNDPRVNLAVKTSYGAFPELCREISRYLEEDVAQGQRENIEITA